MFETTGAWDHKERRQVLPDAIRTMPPGPELGTLLATVDRSRLNGHEMVLLLSARARQIAHLQAEFYADVWELALPRGRHRLR